MVRLSQSLGLASGDAHTQLTSRSNTSAESPMHRSSRVGVVGITPHHTHGRRSFERLHEDILTGTEKKRIEALFYRVGPISKSSAAESLLASFGWTLTEDERFQWFPEEAEIPEGGEPPSRHRPPVTKDEVLDVMRKKKIQFLALADDKENETLATFVALGGKYDGSGTADISTLIEVVQQLRGEPRSRKKSSKVLHEAVVALTSVKAFSSTVAAAQSSDDEDEEPKLMASSLTQDYLLTTQLRTMPRIVRYSEFVDNFQQLKQAASGTASSVSPQRALLQQTTPGTPTDNDLLPVVAAAVKHIAQSGARSSSMSAPHPQFVGAAGGNGARGVGGASLLGVPALRTSVEDGEEWSDGDADSDHQPVEETSPCIALKKSIDECMTAFRSRRAPESTLEKIITLPPSQIAPMSGDGTTWAEILAARKFTARKTIPVTPLMMIREKSQQEILELESAAVLEKQLNDRLKQRVVPTKVRPSSAASRPGPQVGSRVSSGLVRSSDTANEFVGKLARHLEYIERSAIRQPSKRIARPVSACDDVRPATRVARQSAPALVSKWKQGTATRLVQERERALELAIAQHPIGQDTVITPTSFASPQTDLLQPPVAGFERRAASPFLTYPQVGVYRRAPRK